MARHSRSADGGGGFWLALAAIAAWGLTQLIGWIR